MPNRLDSLLPIGWWVLPEKVFKRKMDMLNASMFKDADHVPNFLCDDEIALWNTTLISFNCFALIEGEVKADKCDGACSSIGARRPYYDELVTLDITKLKVFFAL